MDEVAARFSSLLREAGTSLEQPALEATWGAFVAFCREPVECDDERLFLECDISTSHPDRFYVHFARTCYGREPIGHVWSYEVICDFIFALDETLEDFNCTVEADNIEGGTLGAASAVAVEERERFIAKAQKPQPMWKALSERQPLEAQIYIGES